MWHWTFQPIFDSYLLVAMIAAVLLLLVAIPPHFATASTPRKRIVTGLRCTLVFLVCLAMLRPTLIRSSQTVQSQTMVLLLDASRSMMVPDVADRTRWEALRDSLAQAEPQLEQIRQRYELQTYLFDQRATLWSPSPTEPQWPHEPQGTQTDLGTALEDLLRAEAGKRLTAVFLLSDGAQRTLEPRVDAQQPARELGRQGTPLYAISFGESVDQSQTRDVAVESLPDQYTVFVNNELPVRGSIRIQGYAGREVPVQLRIEKPDGTMQQIGPTPVLADQQLEQMQVELSFTPDQVGVHRLVMEVPPQVGERVTENNQLTAFVTVLEGGVRVLYLDGNVGWQERKFLRRSLDESPDVQVDLWLDMRTLREQPLALPISELDNYDVIILGDVSAAALGAENAQAIAAQVTRGKGFLMLGGVHSFGPGGYAESPLAAALPVKMDRLERQVPGEPVRQDVHFDQMLSLAPTGDHFVTRLTAPQDNQQTWSSLPQLQGANRFRELHDQAEVLAVGAENQAPLLVRGNYGLGRVLAFAGDSTYRWQRYGFAEAHRRFWRQVVLWLAQKDETNQDAVWIRMPQRRLAPTARPTFTAGVRDTSGVPVTDVELQVELVHPDGTSTAITATLQQQEWVGSGPPVTLPGDYEFRVQARRRQQAIGSAQGRFMVLEQDLELTDPAANPRHLQSLAELTSEAGGKLLAPEQLASVLGELAELPAETEVEVQSQWTLTDTTTDASALFCLMFGLLAIDWLLRKRWGWV